MRGVSRGAPGSLGARAALAAHLRPVDRRHRQPASSRPAAGRRSSARDSAARARGGGPASARRCSSPPSSASRGRCRARRRGPRRAPAPPRRARRAPSRAPRFSRGSASLGDDRAIAASKNERSAASTSAPRDISSRDRRQTGRTRRGDLDAISARSCAMRSIRTAATRSRLGREVAEQRPLGDAGALRDLARAGTSMPPSANACRRRLEQQPPIALRVGAQRLAPAQLTPSRRGRRQRPALDRDVLEMPRAQERDQHDDRHQHQAGRDDERDPVAGHRRRRSARRRRVVPERPAGSWCASPRSSRGSRARARRRSAGRC